MNIYIYYILLSIFIFYLFFIVFLYLLNFKINKLENIILIQFKEKNNQIPSLYEITKKYFIKHDKIFKEILLLRKKDFSENSIYLKLIQKSKTNKLIHNELNFIFRVCFKYPKILKDWKYLYLNEIIIKENTKISENIKLYKLIIKKYNNLIFIKNITIIWLLFPINTKKNF